MRCTLRGLFVLFAVLLWTIPASADWPVVLGDEIHSSPVVADLEPDGVAEVAIFCTDGTLHLLTPDGEPHAGLWPQQICPPSTIDDGQNWVSGSAAIADLDGLPGLEIIQAGLDGRLHALDSMGSPKPGFPVQMGAYCVDTPTVADLDGDGELEIICRYDPHLVGVWSANGILRPGWPRSVANSPGGALDVWSSSAVGDLDGDGDLEIVMGDFEGFGHAFHDDGSTVAGWPVNLNPTGGYTGWVLSSPACADLDGDGADEVVIGADDDRLFVLRGDGTDCPGWPRILPFGFRSSPALADLDGDEDLEIVIGQRYQTGYLKLYAMHDDGTDLPGWPINLPPGGGGYTFGWLPALLVDLVGDDLPEIVAVKERSAAYPARAELYLFNLDGDVLNGFPQLLMSLAYGAPTVCDLDGDGLADILIGDLSHRLHRFEPGFAIHPGNEAVEWRCLQKDMAHTGRVTMDLTDVALPANDAGDRRRLAALPNPFRESVMLHLSSVGDRREIPSAWRIFDIRGRKIRDLQGDGTGAALWDGMLEEGRPAPAGIYLARPIGRRESVRLLKLR